MLTVPPCRCVMSRTMESPRPVPPSCRVRASSERPNRSKIRSRESAGTPGPSSVTVRRTMLLLSERVMETAAVAWRTALLQQVSHDATELARVTQQMGGGNASGVDRDRRGGS